MERVTNVNTIKSSFQSVHTYTGDMTDGFGSDISFGIQDNDGVINELGTVGFIRDGADDAGKFVVVVGGVSWGTKMVVDKNGNVGIGTTTPTTKLDVNGSVNVNGNVTPAVNDTYSLGTPDLIWEHAYFGSNSIYIGGIKLSAEGDELRWNDDKIGGLWTNSSGNVTLATGNVGIGDSDPETRLEVLDTTGPQFRITHTEDTDYGDFAVDSDGNLTISSSSGNVFIQLG
jgi:hypothetical protein